MDLTKNCTGCMACYNKCPNGAISITYNEAGYYIPVIDNTKCTNCGLCNSVCPQIKKINKEKEEATKCYAVMCNDELRKNSASGGLFAMIAQEYLKKGYYVCGAVFSEDFREVKHIITNNEKDLIRIQNSKYTQSYIGDVFTKIKKLLDENKEVLFGGTPCQIAGLKSYLGKDYKNLLTMDVICHSIPSPLVWKKFVDENAKGKKVLKASFRNKKYTWHASQTVEFVLKNWPFTKKIKDNIFYRIFLEHLSINNPCCDCKYANLKRISDITMADFWGIDKVDIEMDDKKGTSLLIINTNKGQEVFEKYKKNFLKYKEFDIKTAMIGNPRLYRCSEPHLGKDNFEKNLHKMPVIKNMKESLCPKYEGVIRNFWAYNNFGATLSAYAIQQFFQERGKDYYILQTYTPGDFTKPFADKYIKTTHLVFSEEHYKELNKCTDNFVVGTDQILRPSFMEGHIDEDLYGYTNFNKKRISFSGSFGLNYFENTGWLNKLKYSKLINRFDSISVREISGIDICKTDFNINAECIIDPVFLIDKQKWLDIALDTKDKYKGKIVCYIFDMFGAKSNEIKEYLEKKYNKEVIMLKNMEIPLEEFISAIKDADAILTNSFHGTCFSLIFNKKLLAITNVSAGDARFDSLVKIFGIDNITVNSINDVFVKDNLFNNFDYNKFLSILEIERKKADTWFEKHINTPKKITLKSILAELDYKIFLQIERLLYHWTNWKFYYLCNKKNAKIVFWGASIYLDHLLEKNPKIIKNIIGIIDKNPARHYKKFHGCTVFPPEKLSELNPKLVISAVKNNHETIYPKIKKYIEENHPTIKLLEDIFN